MTITNFHSKPLARLYESGDERGIRNDILHRVQRILSLLDRAAGPHAVRLPGLDLHRLKGQLQGHWAVSVNANWRITFTFRDGHVADVNLVDYH